MGNTEQLKSHVCLLLSHTRVAPKLVFLLNKNLHPTIREPAPGAIDVMIDHLVMLSWIGAVRTNPALPMPADLQGVEAGLTQNDPVGLAIFITPFGVIPRAPGSPLASRRCVYQDRKP